MTDLTPDSHASTVTVIRTMVQEASDDQLRALRVYGNRELTRIAREEQSYRATVSKGRCAPSGAPSARYLSRARRPGKAHQNHRAILLYRRRRAYPTPTCPWPVRCVG